MKRKVVYILMFCMTLSLLSACGRKPVENAAGEKESGQSGSATESEVTDSEMTPESESESLTESEPETVPESEPETAPESEPVQEETSNAEDTGETEAESSNGQEEATTEDVTGNEEVKQEELPVGAEIEASELLEDMKAVFDSALDFIVPEEELDAASMVSNAILNKTDISINYVENGICNITVTYPNAANALKEAEAKLAADASQEELDTMLNTLAQAITDGEVEMVEKTLDVSVIEIGEFRTIEWTKELYDAITGGLYSIE